MSARWLAGLTAMAIGVLLAVGSLQYVLHVGSCGNGPNALAYGNPACPGGLGWKILLGLLGLGIAFAGTMRLGRTATPIALGLGFTLIGVMFAILGFVPAPGDHGTWLGAAVGAPFDIGGLIAFVVAWRRMLN